MAVRREKKKGLFKREEATTAIEEAERDLSPKDLELRRVLPEMLRSQAYPDVMHYLMTSGGMSRGAAKSLIQRTREEIRQLGLSFIRTGRTDQVVSLRRLHGRLTGRLAQLVQEEAKARKKSTEKGPDEVPDYNSARVDRATAEILKLEGLIASVEGNHAPVKQFTVSADISQDVLALLGVQTPEEIQELIDEGNKEIETEGYEVDDEEPESKPGRKR